MPLSKPDSKETGNAERTKLLVDVVMCCQKLDAVLPRNYCVSWTIYLANPCSVWCSGVYNGVKIQLSLMLKQISFQDVFGANL